MRNFFSKVVAIAILTSPLAVMANTFSYNNGVLERSQAFRYGTSEVQGMAMRLSAEKLALIKGSVINTVSAAFGSKRTTDGTVTLFIAKSLDSDPIYTQTVSLSSAVKWLDFALDTPYAITDDEGELYIGYTASIATTSSLLMADYQQDYSNSSFYLGDNGWEDMAGSGRGAVAIRIGVDQENSFADMLLKPVSVEGYFQVGNKYDFTAQAYNFGTEAVSSLDIKVSIPGSDPQIIKFEDINVQPGGVFDFTIQDCASENEGKQQISFEISSVNGVQDVEPSDNSYSSQMFFYPANMERSFLIEAFTGQACSNCPTGHYYLSNFVHNTTESNFIEVMHHIGYQPDDFTMASDVSFLYLYGSSSTFAPAFTINRTQAPLVGTAPVVEVSQSNLQGVYEKAAASQPYASLALDTKFDENTRKLNATIGIYVHNDFPTDKTIFNIFLIQDSLVRNQTGAGRAYVHNAVYRGNLTGNSWGYLLTPEYTHAESYFEWTAEFDLPENILSDYNGEAEIPVVLKDMRLVALVGAFDGTNPSGCNVYNAIDVALGEAAAQNGISGITSVELPKNDLNVWVDASGMMQFSAECDQVDVYDLAGRKANHLQPLTKGIYVVRAYANGSLTVKKLVVR